MTAPALRREELLGLALALVGHAALFAWLVWQKPAAPPPPLERMTVTISDDLAATSSAPNPNQDAAPDKGPELGEAPPPEPVPTPSAVPQAQLKVQPKPDQTSPQLVTPPSKPQAQQAKAPPQKLPQKPGKPGSSVFDSAFSNGIPGAKPNGKSGGAPAVATGQLKSSWTSLIGSKVRGPWNSCPVSGLEVEKLYIDVRFTLNPDGSIQSLDDPVVNGVTPANRAQAAPFKACAIRAIKLAAPFKGLPAEYYDDWKLRLLRLRKQ